MTQSTDIQTPVFVLAAARLRANLETAKRVREEAGCKILLATKAFSLPAALSAEMSTSHWPMGSFSDVTSKS